MRFTTVLGPRGTTGQLSLNGGGVGTVAAGGVEMRVQPRPGANHVEGVLTEGRPGATWRFDFAEGLEPGTLAPLQGEVVQVTAESILFRLKGEVGERVSFSFRRKE
jgi:hypothetical protein